MTEGQMENAQAAHFFLLHFFEAVQAMGCGVALPFSDWFLWWRAVSRLTCAVASHAVLTWRAGEGGGLILPALAKSAPTLPSPPRHHSTARCAACGCKCKPIEATIDSVP